MTNQDPVGIFGNDINHLSMPAWPWTLAHLPANLPDQFQIVQAAHRSSDSRQ
jgi:hypothetical protein